MLPGWQLFALLQAVDHTDVIVTSAKDIVVAMISLLAVLVGSGIAIGVPIHKKAVRERTEARTIMQETHEQLHNDHPKNFRVEFDDKFAELAELVNVGFDGMNERLDKHSRDIAATKRASEAAVKKTAAIEARLTKHIDGDDTSPAAQ